jgi:hypothetical protein
MSIEAMKAALKALESINEISKPPMNIPLAAEIDGAMDALRKIIQEATLQKISDIGQEIEQAEKQEKLCKYCGGIGRVVCDGKCMPGQAGYDKLTVKFGERAKEYLVEAKKSWIGMSDVEIAIYSSGFSGVRLAKEIEAQLKERNT